ncbi:transcription termination/antitermination protein NusG [Desulfurobacterium thermolithotrophum]|uniref:transcription termination/antitermination protein NusG n=1 Tax=Desulfurobacterium thermolithotrophum TaxID=64160 RepID=UPI0013D467BD|nr:transcription termination/antitermination NusG family protein [Desulfurobacterium thermolithotrophum]
MFEIDTPKWHVVYIKPRKEEVVKVQLERIGIKTFYPKVKVVKKGIEKVEPMFPLYMFAKFSVVKDFFNVHFARGVRRVVKFGNQVPSLSEEFIEYLRSVNGCLIENKLGIKESYCVKIVDGPFRNFIGKVLKMKRGEERVVVILKAMNSLTLEVPVEYVEITTERKNA